MMTCDCEVYAGDDYESGDDYGDDDVLLQHSARSEILTHIRTLSMGPVRHLKAYRNDDDETDEGGGHGGE